MRIIGEIALCDRHGAGVEAGESCLHIAPNELSHGFALRVAIRRVRRGRRAVNWSVVGLRRNDEVAFGVGDGGMACVAVANDVDEDGVPRKRTARKFYGATVIAAGAALMNEIVHVGPVVVGVCVCAGVAIRR